MHFSLLGPLQVRSGGTEVPIRGRLRRTLLAALVLNHDTVIPADHLIHLLWGEDADSGAPLHNQLMRLRQALGDDTQIQAIPPGYQIHVAPPNLDLTEFTNLQSQASDAAAAADWNAGAKLYTAALALWRGDILADIPALQSHPTIHRYTENRLVALQGRIEADLNLGRHAEVIDELRTLTAAHPLRESFHAQLMLAFHRSARQPEALAVYRTLRRRTLTELGMEPSPKIQSLHTQIQTTPTKPTRPSDSAPRQLPADTRLFTGRHPELAELTTRAHDTGTVVISAINGMGGVGKTALAVHAAHHLHDRYPDGQLFIDLHGYSADLDPVAPEDALDYLLRSLGVPPQSIPADLDARTTLYRTKLADTKTLILLDNAANATQVAPLLPESPTCLVLVTSRTRLTALENAHQVALDVLPHKDALALLREVAGPARVSHLAENQEAAATLVTLCAHTPLAIRIAAARLRHDKTLTAEALAAELADESNRLTHLQDDDRNLTTVFNSSLRTLPKPAQELFRLLGLIPGPDFAPHAAAHLTATDLQTAEHHLTTLLNHNLLIQHAPTRYRLHDLLRAHARTLATQDPTSPAAFTRLVDHYVATACAADDLITNGAEQRSRLVQVPAAADPALELADRASGQEWLRREQINLLAFIDLHTTSSERRHALIGAMTQFLRDEGPWATAERLQLTLQASAREHCDRALEASALSELGFLGVHLGTPEKAASQLDEAVAIYREIGDERSEASTLRSIGSNHFRRGDFNRALPPFEQALALYRKLGATAKTADLLFWIGCIAHSHGDNATANVYYDEAIEIHETALASLGVASTLLVKSRSAYALEKFDAVRPILDRGLAIARQSTNKLTVANFVQEIARQQLLVGEYADAERLLDEALALHLEIGFRLGEGNIEWERGRIAAAHGRFEEAMERFTRSLDIFVEIGTGLNHAAALHELAKLHQRAGDYDLVGDLLDQALQIYVRGQYLVGEAEVHNAIAAYRAEVEGAEAGLELFREAERFAVRAQHPLERARALEGMARCEVQLGMRDAGVEHLSAAVGLYGRMRVVEFGAADALLDELRAGLVAG